MKINPKVLTRPATCNEHGDYTERGGSMFGDMERVFWWGCPACADIKREKDESEQKAREEADRQARIEARLNAAGIPIAFRTRTFDNYRAQLPEQAHALAIAKEYADRFWPEHYKAGRSLVFSGNPGTGKSHLALAIGQSVMSRGTVMYRDVMDIVRMVRSTWGRASERSEDEVFRLLGEQIDLLIIDEIGVQRGTEDEQVILFDILNRRYRDNRPTILLTNLGGKGLTEFLGPRIIDRLREKAIFVPFRWTSYRANWAE